MKQVYTHSTVERERGGGGGGGGGGSLSLVDWVRGVDYEPKLAAFGRVSGHIDCAVLQLDGSDSVLENNGEVRGWR